MKVTSLYLCPWSLNDPLTQSQSLAYIKGLTADNYNFALITLETSRFLMSPEKVRETKNLLESEKIFWYPVRWNSGNSIFSKLLSICVVFYTGFKAYFKHRPRLIHSRSSLPLFLALLLHKVGRSKFLYDADSTLSEEYADVGHLNRKSLGFRLLSGSESLARRSANRIIVLTQTMKEDFISKYSIKKDIDVIPCCVNIDKFKFSEKHRQSKRAELNLTDELLFIYVGKIGTWYLVEEMIDFFQTVLSEDKSAKLLIVTQESPEIFKAILDGKNLDQAAYFIKRAEHFEVTGWLSAADVGLAFIKPLPSKRGTSPVKTSEYMANGLVIVSGTGIGDLDEIIEENKVGVIIPEFNSEFYARAFKQIDTLLENVNLRRHCSETAYQEFDLYRVGVQKYRQIYQDILQDS